MAAKAKRKNEAVKPTRDEKYKLFVYGTLKQGFNNHKYLLSEASFLGREYLEGNFTMIEMGMFPGVIAGGEGTGVYGEVYAVTEKELEACDGLEGHPSFYKRTEMESEFGDSFIYLLPPDYLDGSRGVVPTGCWRPYKEELAYVEETEKANQKAEA